MFLNSYSTKSRQAKKFVGNETKKKQEKLKMYLMMIYLLFSKDLLGLSSAIINPWKIRNQERGGSYNEKNLGRLLLQAQIYTLVHAVTKPLKPY